MTENITHLLTDHSLVVSELCSVHRDLELLLSVGTFEGLQIPLALQPFTKPSPVIHILDDRGLLHRGHRVRCRKISSGEPIHRALRNRPCTKSRKSTWYKEMGLLDWSSSQRVVTCLGKPLRASPQAPCFRGSNIAGSLQSSDSFTTIFANPRPD